MKLFTGFLSSIPSSDFNNRFILNYAGQEYFSSDWVCQSRDSMLVGNFLNNPRE
jgi:hypothetical protein